MEKSDLIKKLEYALVNKVVPELFYLMKQLSIEEIHYELSLNYVIFYSGDIFYGQSYWRREECIKITNFSSFIKNNPIIFSSEKIIVFCTEIKKKITELRNLKKAIEEIVKMEVTYKKVLLTEKYKSK